MVQVGRKGKGESRGREKDERSKFRKQTDFIFRKCHPLSAKELVNFWCLGTELISEVKFSTF
jgi:hypothetical protein